VSLGNNTGVVYLDTLSATAGVAALLLTQRIFFTDAGDRASLHRLLTTGAVILALAAAAGATVAEAAQFTTPFLLRLVPVLLPAAIVLTGIAAALRQKYAPAAHIYTAGWLALFIGAGLSATGLSQQAGVDVYWIFLILHTVLVSFAALYFTF